MCRRTSVHSTHKDIGCMFSLSMSNKGCDFSYKLELDSVIACLFLLIINKRLWRKPFGYVEHLDFIPNTRKLVRKAKSKRALGCHLRI